MNWFTNLRLLAFLRRAVRALEDLAVSQRIIARCTQDAWEKENAPHKTRKSEFGALDQKKANRAWRDQMRAQGLEVEVPADEEE